MTHADVQLVIGVSPGDTPISFKVGTSLIEALDRSVGGGAASLSGSLRKIRDLVRRGESARALRDLDRVWRTFGDDEAMLAPIYGRLMFLESRDYNAAWRLLSHSASHSAGTTVADPDIAALNALALLRLNRPEDARRQIANALADYCVFSESLLSLAAGEIAWHPAIDAPGWIGRGPQLDLVGELSPHEDKNSLDIRLDGKAAYTQLLPHVQRDGNHAFCLQSPADAPGTPLEANSRGRPLLGSGAVIHADFGCDGRVKTQGRRLSGWSRLGWSPSQPPRLHIEDGAGRRIDIKCSTNASSDWRWPFDIDLGNTRLRGQRFMVSAQLPDHRWQELPDSPLLLESRVRLHGRRVQLGEWEANEPRSRRRVSSPTRARMVDVIIPVYRGLQESLACIGSVLATIGDRGRIIVIDDASDDPALCGALEQLETEGNIRLLRNVKNLGFVASVNRALALNQIRDVVFLNSDTRVFGDWLERMRDAAYSGPRVGTVTPLSNAGSIASYPRPEGAAIDPDAGAFLHALASTTQAGVSVEIPVGVGFCLYLRQDCLREIGVLDEALFGKGYGEETDFCLRARRRGWTHRLAADVFVYHAGGRSFGARRHALLDRAQRLINIRHPGYDRFVKSFLRADPIHAVRRRLDEERLKGYESRFVLLVTLALEGGVNRFVAGRLKKLKEQGLTPLVLKPCVVGNRRRVELWCDAIEVPNLSYHIPHELPALSALLAALPIDSVDIQHFMHLDARVIDAVRALPAPHDIFIHDYAWACPRVTLIDGTKRYCGEPAVSVCEVCVKRNGSNLGESISVAALRTRSARWLEGARRVFAPSADTAARLRRHFEGVDVEIVPHSEPIGPAQRSQKFAGKPAHAAGEPLRVVLIGAIGTHKGYRVLLECARDARRRGLPIEFIVIGYTENDPALTATGKVFVTGRYEETEVPHLIEREQADIAWLPSVWPETWCYTLDHALAAGLPVVAFDIGAIAERLRALQVGELLPMDLKAPDINDHLLRFDKSPGESLGESLVERPGECRVEREEPATLKPSQSMQTGAPHLRDDVKLRENNNNESPMIKPPAATPPPAVKDDGLSASVQVLPMPPGLYLFSVTAGTPASQPESGQLSLPAMHVGLGPGVRSDQVDFVAGPSTHGAWLFAVKDCLVTKVHGAGAALVLTSVRAPGGEVLSIAVERLDDRTASLAGTARAAAPAISQTPASPIRAKAGAAPTKNATDSLFAADDLPLPVQIGAHVRTRGDMTFSDGAWAGRIAPGLWIESFSVLPLRHFKAQDIEYKALTGSGFETPWLSDNKMCGTKGMATPLVGFAIRLKPSSSAALYDTEYSGYFQSGTTVGPLRNGAPCRSTVANDPLEGIQVRIVKRVVKAPLETARKSNPSPEHAAAPPSRDVIARTAKRAPKKTARKKRIAAHRTPTEVARPVRRKPTRNS